MVSKKENNVGPTVTYDRQKDNVFVDLRHMTSIKVESSHKDDDFNI